MEELHLGRHSFDVRTASVVIARSDRSAGERAVHDLIAQRPAAIAGTWTDGEHAAQAICRIGRMFAGPIGVRSSSAAVIADALAAGAAFALDPSGLADPWTLAAVEAHDASLVIAAPPVVVDEAAFLDERAAWSRSAGIDPARIVLLARDRASVDALGDRHHVAVEVTDRPAEAGDEGGDDGGDGGQLAASGLAASGLAASGLDGEAESWGMAAAAVMAGARVILTHGSAGHLRSIRRTVDTIGELFDRRSAHTPSVPPAP